MNSPPKRVKSKCNHFDRYKCCKIIFNFFRYKEGRVILEQALITESEGFPDPYSTPPAPSSRHNNQNNHYPD